MTNQTPPPDLMPSSGSMQGPPPDLISVPVVSPEYRRGSIGASLRRMQEPGYVPPAAQPIPTLSELGRQYKDVGRATGAELGKLVTGAGELLPGAAGEASAAGTRYLEQIAREAGKTPGATEISKALSLAAPIPGISRYLGAAKGLGQLARRGVGTGAALGAATPTGTPELSAKIAPICIT